MKDYTLTPRESELFWAKVEKTETCWNWTRSLSKNGGYGQYFTGSGPSKVVYMAHRLAYSLLVGPIPAGAQLDHICHNRTCVNPEHLRPVDHKQNAENHQGATKNSKSGVRGVYWHERARKWHGQVRHNGVRYYAGLHVNLEDAEAATVALRNKLFTHNEIDRDRVAA